MAGREPPLASGHGCPLVSLAYCLPEAAHPTTWIGDRSVEFVRANAGGTRPWYLFASFIHPHPPFAPPDPWHKLYRAPLMPLPHTPPDMQAKLEPFRLHAALLPALE